MFLLCNTGNSIPMAVMLPGESSELPTMPPDDKSGEPGLLTPAKNFPFGSVANAAGGAATCCIGSGFSVSIDGAEDGGGGMYGGKALGTW